VNVFRDHSGELIRGLLSRSVSSFGFGDVTREQKLDLCEFWWIKNIYRWTQPDV